MAEPGHALIVGLLRALADTEVVKPETDETGSGVHVSFSPEECTGEMQFWTDEADGRLHVKVRWL